MRGKFGTILYESRIPYLVSLFCIAKDLHNIAPFAIVFIFPAFLKKNFDLVNPNKIISRSYYEKTINQKIFQTLFVCAGQTSRHPLFVARLTFGSRLFYLIYFLNHSSPLHEREKNNCKETSTCNSLVSLDKFSRTGRDDLEWFIDLLGQ